MLGGVGRLEGDDGEVWLRDRVENWKKRAGSSERMIQRWVRRVRERGWVVWKGKMGALGKTDCHSGELMKEGCLAFTEWLNCISRLKF